MSVEEQQPSMLDQLARRAAQELARRVVIKVALLLGAKGIAIVALVMIALALIALLIALIVAAASAPFQSSTLVWPVPVATDAAGNYPAAGWAISSRFGWRDDPLSGKAEFHDGIDLANPVGGCPFGYRCGAPAIFDGSVRYVGWDMAGGDDPSRSGGGMVVVAANGQDDHQTIYAHLEPYRLYVQLQGRVVDPYGRYDDYSGYQPIGAGPLQPDLTNGAIMMLCAHEMPRFIPMRTGPGTVVFLYDRPAACTTTVVWGERGGGWHGWTPDDPGGKWSDPQRADLRWRTPFEPGARAGDVALRFRAHLTPPPPPPTTTPTDTMALTPTPEPQAQRRPTRSGIPRSCETLASGWARCAWSFADIPNATEPGHHLAIHAANTPQPAGIGAAAPDALLLEASTPTPIILPAPPPMPGGEEQPPPGEGSASGPGANPICAPEPPVTLVGVRAPLPRLAPSAAASFAIVRARIVAQTNVDALATLADALRHPSFRTDKPGVLDTSWHKAGRAIDLDQGGPFTRIPEGRMFRLYVHGVDITAIFEAHGWNRIPIQGTTLEWWHYEYHPDRIAWTSAMRQVWPLATLQAAFPAIDWAAISCQDAALPPGPIDSLEAGVRCVAGAPSYARPVEDLQGCGPPVRAGDKIYQLDTLLGFVGLTGRTSGPHLHLGLKVKSYDGFYRATDVCTPEWLGERVAAPDSSCWTEMADPLAFLTLAPPPAAPAAAPPPVAPMNVPRWITPTAIIPEGAPYQLPPPNYPGSLLFTPVPDAPAVGQYWSPFADGGRYGGGGVQAWLCSVIWNGFPWCS